jgi:hypothetical protein
MSMLLQFLLAAALIAGMILIRILAGRMALQARILDGYNNDCNEEECMSCTLKTIRKNRVTTPQS